MDYNKQHPLSQVTASNSLSILEMLIPYVDYPFKLPLALLIKFNEIRIIINTFHDPELMKQLGLHNTNSSMTDILASMTGISPDMLRMLMNMTEYGFPGTGSDSPFDFQNLFHGFEANGLKPSSSEESVQTPTKLSSVSTSDSAKSPSYNFDDRIHQLFAEYDKQI